jgi:hypothetical protein
MYPLLRDTNPKIQLGAERKQKGFSSLIHELGSLGTLRQAMRFNVQSRIECMATNLKQALACF